MGRWTGLALFAVGAASLACGGDQFARSVLNADVQEGGAATLPADFPLSPPAGATLSAVMKADLLGTSTVTAVFVLPAGADAKAALEAVAVEMEGKGMTVERSGDSVTGHKDQDNWVAALGDVDGAPALSLIVAHTNL
jgi:hypothetical protein